MADCMMFPEDWNDFLNDYSFDDSQEVYTNGSRLIPVFRVEQLIEHLLKEQEPVEPEQVDVYGEDEWWGLVCVCPDCKTEWMCDKDATHFCPNCGRPVKWE